jgi:hypothetical protein
MSGEPRLTVGEERLKQLFAEFKLELSEMLAKKANLDAHELLDHRVRVLELWQAAQVATERVGKQVSTRQLAVAALLVAVFVGVLTATASLLSNLIH